MKVEELRLALEKLILTNNHVLTDKVVIELEKLSHLLLEYSTISVDEFCAVASKATKRPAPKKRVSSAPSLNEAAIVSYLKELDASRTDNQKFELVISRMKTDKQIRVAEAREVARRFIGGSDNYKTKPDAYRAILQRQFADVRAAHKVERIGDIF